MGSFYATCSITDVSIIDNDKMYMQLILPTWVKNPHSIDGEKIGCGEKGLRVSNEGAMAEFVPFGFPIEGHYADYGDIDGIVKTRNVEMLEKFFNLSMEDIIGCATDDRWVRYGMDEDRDSGSHDWTIGGNKMENIEILKQLTVTYFKKEHYDYLSEDFRGDDSYWMEESKKRQNKMKKALKKLGKHNATISSKPKKPELTFEEITEEHISAYREVFLDEDETMTDDQIKIEYLSMQSYSNDSNDYKLSRLDMQYLFPIPSIAKYDMYALLPLTEEDFTEVKKQHAFIINMHSLYKVIRPSYYGSQSDNFGIYADFHKFSAELVSEHKVEMAKSEIGYYIEEALEGLDGYTTEQREEIYKVITDDLKNSRGLEFY